VVSAPPVPLARPVTAAPPPSPPVFAPADEDAPIVQRRQLRGRRSGWLIAAGLLAGAGLAAAAVVLLILHNRSEPGPGHKEAGQLQQFKRENCRFVLPAKPWAKDAPLQQAFQATVAIHRTDPSAWLLLLVKDYKDREPRKSDLIDEAVRFLRETTQPAAKATYFQSVQWESRPECRLADRPALQLEFEAVVNEVLMSGECTMLTSRGFAYWVFLWAPRSQRQQAAAEWDELRKGLSLLSEREGWTPGRLKARVAQRKEPDRVAYSLRYPEGIWGPRKPEDYDKLADVALFGHDPAERAKHATKAAVALVLLLPRQDNVPDAVKAARTHLLNREKEIYPETTVEALQDAAAREDRPPGLGQAPFELWRLRVQNTDERALFVVQAVVPLAEGVLVLQCECDWNRRSFWEEEFLDLWQGLTLMPEAP
jgi:hypothetical protein